MVIKLIKTKGSMETLCKLNLFEVIHTKKKYWGRLQLSNELYKNTNMFRRDLGLQSLTIRPL